MFNKAGVLVRANSTSYASALRNYLATTTNPGYGGVILSTIVVTSSSCCVVTSD
jgi:hypothetical protein